MLGVNTYAKEYIDACRSRLVSHVSACKALIKTATAGTKTNTPAKAAAEAFEPVFFGALLQVLDGHFLHRRQELNKESGARVQRLGA